MIVKRAIAREGRLDLVLQAAVLLRARQPFLAFGGVFVGLPPRNMKKMADEFGGLAHVEVDDRIGEAAFEADHGR